MIRMYNAREKKSYLIMSRHTSSFRLFVISAIALLLVSSVGAQSGRRVRKVTAPPVPMPTPDAIPVKSTEKPKPALTVVIGLERRDYYGNSAMVSAAGALQVLVDRLEDHPGVKAAQVSRDMTRSEAIKKAKSEKEAYVIFLELGVDRMTGNQSEFRLSYWVFSPVTSKVKTSGQTYPRMYRTRGVILDPRAPTVYGDRQLEEAARDVAERILKAFHLHLTNQRPVV